jgi:hypothetical protein
VEVIIQIKTVKTECFRTVRTVNEVGIRAVAALFIQIGSFSAKAKLNGSEEWRRMFFQVARTVPSHFQHLGKARAGELVVNEGLKLGYFVPLMQLDVQIINEDPVREETGQLFPRPESEIIPRLN